MFGTMSAQNEGVVQWGEALQPQWISPISHCSMEHNLVRVHDKWGDRWILSNGSKQSHRTAWLLSSFEELVSILSQQWFELNCSCITDIIQIKLGWYCYSCYRIFTLRNLKVIKILRESVVQVRFVRRNHRQWQPSLSKLILLVVIQVAMQWTRIGHPTDWIFVTGYNPKHYTPKKVTTSVSDCLCKAKQATSQVPKFHQMVFKTHKIFHQERTSSTQAFIIEFPTHSVPQLISILKEVAKDTKEYVAFQMRQKNPDAFQGAIRYQKHIIANWHMVMINHLGMDAMNYLTDCIQILPGSRMSFQQRKE